MKSNSPLYPWPQWSEYGSEYLTLPGQAISAYIAPGCQAAGKLLAELFHQRSFSLETVSAPEQAALILAENNSAWVQERMRPYPELLAQPLPAEGYCLLADGKGIVIATADISGGIYGVSALMQLLQREVSAWRCRHAQVRDWPYKPMRGVHLYMPSRQNLPFFKRMLTWLATMRYNTLFLEIGGGMRYQKHPEINESWAKFCAEANAYPGGPSGLHFSQSFIKDSPHTELAGGFWLEQEEVAEIAAHAASLGMEVIPEAQSLSHAYYLVLPHREIAERPSDPWPDTYCPSNPYSYELYFDVLDEIIGVFRPKRLHIGHDEVVSLGLCDRCRGKSGAELLAGDLERICAYLRPKGIRPIIWGDKLQNIITGGREYGGRACRGDIYMPQWTDHVMRETYPAVDFVPKDILICDFFWHIDPLSEYYFRQKGYELLFGNFGDNFEPQAFSEWSRRSQGQDILGGEISSWCDASEYALGHNLFFFNCLTAANMFWWPHYQDCERGETITASAQLQAAARTALTGNAPIAAPGKAVALHQAASSAVPYRGQGEWHAATPAIFKVEDKAVTADAAQPDSTAIGLGHRAQSLAFLHYCLSELRARPTYYFPNTMGYNDAFLLGYYRVLYSDGSEEQLALRFGDNISCPDTEFGEDIKSTPFWAEPAWTGRDNRGRHLTYWAYTWANPHPEKEIASVSLHYRGQEKDGKIVLLALNSTPA